MKEKLTCAKAPCKSCPYRRDVPSGVWAESEYVKLPQYDGTPTEQAIKDAFRVFMCHQQDGKLCAGWVGCHGANNLVALKIAVLYDNEIAKAVWQYKSPVPLFGSGAEASAHGLRDVEQPSTDAKRVVARLVDKLRSKR